MPGSKTNNPNQIRFKYIFDPMYNPTYANGAYGGVNPQGEIVVHFYLERKPVPNQQIQTLNKNGSLGEIVESDPEDVSNLMVRFVSTGIVLNYQSAKTIHQWLGEHLKLLEPRNVNTDPKKG